MRKRAVYTHCHCGVTISTEGLWAVCTECRELAPVREMGFRCMKAAGSHIHRVQNTHKRCRHT